MAEAKAAGQSVVWRMTYDSSGASTPQSNFTANGDFPPGITSAWIQDWATRLASGGEVPELIEIELRVPAGTKPAIIIKREKRAR